MYRGRKTAIIVDAYSSGNKLPLYLKKHGITCAHIQSMKHILSYDIMSFQPWDFSGRFVFNNNFAELLAWAEMFNPLAIVAGCESGVVLADKIASALNLSCNIPELSIARLDKYLMAKAVEKNQTPVPFSQKFQSLDEADQLAHRHNQWPIIVKPIDSAGAEGIFKCNSIQEINKSATHLFGRTNGMGSINKELLFQEFLCGKQYLINSVSINGQHRISDVWLDERIYCPEGGAITDKRLLLPMEGIVSDEIIPYVKRCLNALGIRFGPAHTEIMLTKNGPLLIEAASRPQGSVSHEVVKFATGESQISLTAALIANPVSFEETIDNAYHIEKPLLAVYLHNSDFGKVIKTDGLDDLLKLNEVVDHIRTPHPGDLVEPTTDLSNILGVIYLSSESPERLAKLHHLIRQKEQQHSMFQIESVIEKTKSIIRAK